MLIGGDPLPNGTKVSFTVSGLSGTGVLRGIHQIPQAILGTGYIVEWDTLSGDWPYPCISVFECYLEVIG